MPEFEEFIHEEIDNYLTGRMSATEKGDFEARIAGDPLLKEEVDFQRKVMGAVQFARKEELKNYIRASVASEKRILLSRPWWLSAAAAVLIISMVGIYINNKQNEVAVTNEKALDVSAPLLKDSGNANSTINEDIPEEGGKNMAEVNVPEKDGKLPSPPTSKLALISDTVLLAKFVESEEDKDILPAAKSNTNPEGKIKVELYNALNGEAGYIFHNDKLKLYGFITDVNRISLTEYKRNYYLTYGLEVYQLLPQNKLTKFAPVRDAATLRKIGPKMQKNGN